MAPPDGAAKIRALRLRAIAIAKKIDWLPLLLLRLNMGVLFLSTGWGKIHSIDKVTEFFRELKIPAPGFHAVLVGWTELIGGVLLILGLGARFAGAALATTMVVAIITAKRGDIHGLSDLAGTDEFTYLLVLLTIAILGAGKVSIDRIIEKKIDPDT
jgi:putative oxidoreductase